jgi:membrane protease YdiL (CAAX protease family)
MLWDAIDLKLLLPLVCAGVSFVLYWRVIKNEQLKRYFFSRLPFDKASVLHLVFSKLFGFIVLGLIPLMICTFLLPEFSFGICSSSSQLVNSFVWAGLLALVIVPLTFHFSQKPENLQYYPQLRIRKWTYSTVLIYLASWAVYLLGYELLFRGILLFPLVEALGIWPAIAVNTLLYSAVHLLNSPKESIGSIPFGIVLCLITIETEGIWAAYLSHVCLSWTNALTALYHHPDIEFIGNKSRD